MGSKLHDLPDGFGLQSSDWHFEKLVEFTKLKMQIGEPSPHLTIIGWMCKDLNLQERIWLMGCYGATYCLPSAQAIFSYWSMSDIVEDSQELYTWLQENWPGIVTRTERRSVRTVQKMHRCLVSYADWGLNRFSELYEIDVQTNQEYYDAAFEKLTDVYSFGRYISIRVMEGFRRYCGIERAELYDARSVGGWSPKVCMMYLYPEYVEMLRRDDSEANAFMDDLFYKLLDRIQEILPNATSYIVAAMLCEYRVMYEKRKQYTGWTIDQEPLLYDKAFVHWGDELDKDMLWQARREIFPIEVLGELNGWNGTRWNLTNTLRDYGYNWSDMLYDYTKTTDIANPVKRS